MRRRASHSAVAIGLTRSGFQAESVATRLSKRIESTSPPRYTAASFNDRNENQPEQE